MTYKVIRNATGDLVCYGPNNNNYEPTVAVGNAQTIEATVPTTSLAQAKLAQIAKINQAAEDVLAAIKAGYPKSEVDTWTVQFDEATALALSATAKTPTIDGIVLTSGATKAAIQTKILEKAASAHKISGETIGKRKKLTAQIDAATTNAMAESFVW